MYADTPVDGQCSCGTSRSDATAHRIPCKVTLDEDDAEEEDVTPPRVSQQAKPDTSPPTATPTAIRPTTCPTPQPTVDGPELQALCRLKVGVNTLNVRIDDLRNNPRYEVFDFDEV